ncbi:GNAT family N-acetyltransferase [Flavobacterium beibuense]|uniref:GCN5-related N-acetyltransferase n=1 Tax=Flavobacterium beibuense TaxID=657326 RepID=A0A444W9L8_9FLAO|nr:GNAT family N-acetyltransferase [Flavobacterium beibuense]RYJ42483.1 GCN5-related N-acetyltransferase [Flavobacterium beibuense]
MITDSILITDYIPQYKQAFKNLNEEWISKYFVMEEADYKALDNPESYILDKGGYIVMVLYNNEPVGTCALIKMDDDKYDFELAKMAVSPNVQGKGIGKRLMQAVIEKAKSKGGKWLYLESNTILTPAITLYEKSGFVRVKRASTPYARCNIQMELEL